MSDANRVALWHRKETLWAELPGSDVSTPFTQLRFTGETLEHQKTGEPSEVIREDRMVDSVADLAAQAAGGSDIELAQGNLIWFMEGLLSGTITPRVNVLGTVNAAATADTFTDTGASGDFADLEPGQMVLVRGLSSGLNAGLHEVESVDDADTITVKTTLTTESGGDLSAQMVRNPILDTTITTPGPAESLVRASFLIEKEFSDKAKYFFFPGMRAGQMDLDITAQSRITGALAFLGQQGEFLPTNAAAHNRAPATDPMTASANVQGVEINDQDVETVLGAFVQSIQMSLNGNNRVVPAVGTRFPIDIGEGTIEATGTMNVYFEDETFFNLMTSHTYFKLRLPMLDAAGNGIVITLPRCVFMSGSPTATARNTDVVQAAEFVAVRSPTVGYAIQWDDIAIAA